MRHDIDVDRTAPSKARRFVTGSIRDCLGSDRIDDVLLLTSELVTNAVDHGAAPVSLDLYCDENAISIEVHDAGHFQATEDPLPEERGFDHPEADRGRGLALVAALADEWGITRESSGKTVWFRFNSREGPRRSARSQRRG